MAEQMEEILGDLTDEQVRFIETEFKIGKDKI